MLLWQFKVIAIMAPDAKQPPSGALATAWASRKEQSHKTVGTSDCKRWFSARFLLAQWAGSQDQLHYRPHRHDRPVELASYCRSGRR